MAHSKLRECYKVIENTTIHLDGKVVRCRGLDNLQTQVSTANLPLRLLLPVGSNANGRNLSMISADHTGRAATWLIPELMLLAPVGAGQGLEEYAGPLVDYVVEYEYAILDRRSDYSTEGFLISNMALDTGIYEWPAGSDKWFFGVRSNLTVQELI